MKRQQQASAPKKASQQSPVYENSGSLSDIQPLSARSAASSVRSIDPRVRKPFRVISDSQSRSRSDRSLESIEPSSAKLQQYYEGKQSHRQQQYSNYFSQRSRASKDASVVIEDSLSLVSSSSRGGKSNEDARSGRGSVNNTVEADEPNTSLAPSAASKVRAWVADWKCSSLGKALTDSTTSRVCLYIALALIVVGVAYYIVYRRKSNKSSIDSSAAPSSIFTPLIGSIGSSSIGTSSNTPPSTETDQATSDLISSGISASTAENIQQAAFAVSANAAVMSGRASEVNFTHTLAADDEQNLQQKMGMSRPARKRRVRMDRRSVSVTENSDVSDLTASSNDSDSDRDETRDNLSESMSMDEQSDVELRRAQERAFRATRTPASSRSLHQRKRIENNRSVRNRSKSTGERST